MWCKNVLSNYTTDISLLRRYIVKKLFSHFCHKKVNKKKDWFHNKRVKRTWPALKSEILSWFRLYFFFRVYYWRVFVVLFAMYDVRVKMDARGKVHGIDYRSQ